MRNDDADMPVAAITPFGLRLQPSLKRRIEEAARANGRSLNSEIAARLEKSLQDEVPNFVADVYVEKAAFDDLEREFKALKARVEAILGRL